MTLIAIGWTRGNKKALATILPTKYWEKLRALSNFDYADMSATYLFGIGGASINASILEEFKPLYRCQTSS
jgi:hypothetical protein